MVTVYGKWRGRVDHGLRSSVLDGSVFPFRDFFNRSFFGYRRNDTEGETDEAVSFGGTPVTYASFCVGKINA
jgi:hypothetical protein